MIKNGLYQHFKGGIYRVIGSARHTETDEMLVIYYKVDDSSQTFARPLIMFNDLIEHNGNKIPRFKLFY